MIYLVFFVSFLLGYITNLIALPYILEYVVKDVGRYVRRISTLSIFRWSISFITSFALSALIIQNQRERIMKETSTSYQHTIDSLNFELRMLQQYKAK